MHKLQKMYRVSYFSAVFIFLNSTPAFAYLDPGTGSMILQGILGGLAAVAVVGKIYWRKIKCLLGFKNNMDKNQKNEEMDDKADKNNGCPK